MSWYLYIVRCNDETLYTGISTDISRRIATHNKGKGAKYVRTRLPVELIYSENCGDRVTAIKREIQVKTWPRKRKLSMIESYKITHIAEHQ